MKKILVFIVAFALVFCALAVKDENDIVRIHIVADNDSDEAQSEKIRVRDGVNELIAPLLEKCSTKKEALGVLEENLEKIENIAQNLSERPVRVTLGREEFPEKTYGEKTYPAGAYDALMVRIGSAQGKNWWCVAFPSLCYTTSKNKKVQYRSVFSVFLERLGIG